MSISPDIKRTTSTSSIHRPLGSDEPKVYVVDDEFANRDLLKQFMTSFYEYVHVIEETGGATFLITLENLSKEYEPDLIFLDLRMPFKNGNQVLAEMRKTKPHLIPKVIVVSASGEMIRDVSETEIAAKFIRPVDMEKLAKEIDQKFPDKFKRLRD